MSLSILIEILFWIGIILAFIGGIMIVASFTIFKRKVMKTPIYEEIISKEKKNSWKYMFFFIGVIMIFISYYLALR